MLLTFIFGSLFGAILQYAHVNRYDVISGLAIREDLTVAKMLSLSVGIGIILVNFEIASGLASYHIKPFLLGGIVLGGLVFGSGMAILGYCPGTLAISLGEGSLDALVGILGGLVGGVVFTLLLPYIKPILDTNLGKVSLNTSLGSGTLFFVLVVIIGVVFSISAFVLHKIDRVKDKKWILSGIALAFLNAIIFLTFVSNRPIGASTSYPYFGDLIIGLTNNSYFAKIKVPGHWELIFLAGAVVASFLISLIKKEFKLILIHNNWQVHKGENTIGRVFWSFIGGFILIFGARMAGGCTSGHILSGGMQLAYSSLVFGVFVFISFLTVGELFYKPKK